MKLFKQFGKNASRIIKKRGGMEVVGKNRFGDATLKADIEIEKMVSERLSEMKCSFIGEETEGWWDENAELVFILDPLDGSENYKNGFPSYSFAICVGKLKTRTFSDIEEAFVLDFTTGDKYYARKNGGAFLNGKMIGKRMNKDKLLICADLGSFKKRGDMFSFLSEKGYVRMLGTSTLEMCSAACGRADAFLHLGNSMRVVHSAGSFIMKQAGMNVVDEFGNELEFGLRDDGFNVIATWNPQLQSEILKFLKMTKKSIF